MCNSIVHVFNSLAIFPPVVTIDEIDLVPFGDNVSLVCRAVGSPSFSYVWISPKRLEISSDPELNFTISEVTQYGIYRCEVTNNMVLALLLLK